ncbi:MAG: acyloxyacyl hydrolase [Bacteroidia bacterium]|nr:acyloxyacyl hydrolase [Bacteroidia bacterium]
MATAIFLSMGIGYKKYFLLMLMLCLGYILFAQNGGLLKGLQIGGEYFSGKLLYHRPAQMTFPVYRPVRGFFVEMGKQTDGSKYWHRANGYPYAGWRFTVQDFGNPEVLGKAYGIQPFGDFFIFRTRNVSAYFRYAMGLGWITRPYNRQTNTENTAIGSHLNNLTTLNLGTEIRLDAHFRLRVSGSFVHTSNARVWYPNLGLNTIIAHAGLHYQFEHIGEFYSLPYDSAYHYKRPLLNFRVGLALKEEKVAGGPQYPVYIFSAFVSKMISRRNKVLVGWEIFSDQAIKSFAVNQDLSSPQYPPYLRQNIYIGHEFMFGQVGLITQIFLYVDRPFQGKNYFGIKLGPQWYFFKPQNSPHVNVFSGIYLKTHYAVADYPEMTVGVSF